HEPVAQALEIYLEIARRFPQTRAARDALYTAAICHERLSDYNNYWRGIYGMGFYAGSRMVTYKDVLRAYPGYQLPRGTIGWEPVPRPVNGGPGWATPPRPAPRPTLWSRSKQRLANLFIEMRQKQREAIAPLSKFIESVVTVVFYSLLAILLLAACYFTAVGLYLKNQQSSYISLFKEESIDIGPPDCPTNLTNSPVEKLIKEESIDIEPPDHLTNLTDSPVEKLIKDP